MEEESNAPASDSESQSDEEPSPNIEGRVNLVIRLETEERTKLDKLLQSYNFRPYSSVYKSGSLLSSVSPEIKDQIESLKQLLKQLKSPDTGDEVFKKRVQEAFPFLRIE
jgi:vacuolar-type H+-ATPase subunit I/STV1